MSFRREWLPDPEGYFNAQGLELQRGGAWRTTSCAFHGGSDSMRVNLQTGAFVCMAQCSAKGGDVLAYQMAAYGQTFIEAAKALGAWDENAPPDHQIRQRPMPFPARAGLQVLRDEATLAAVAAGNLAAGVQLSEEERARLLEAAGRIAYIAEVAGI